MDQASASPEASCAHNPVAPRTSSSCSRSVDRSRTGGPPHARSGPQCEPHAAPSNRDSRPSSPAPCRLKAKGYLLPEFYSGATGRSGRFNEGLLLRRLRSGSAKRNIDVSVLPDGPNPKDLGLGQKNLVLLKTSYPAVSPVKMLVSSGTLRTEVLLDSSGSVEILSLIPDYCMSDREP